MGRGGLSGSGVEGKSDDSRFCRPWCLRTGCPQAMGQLPLLFQSGPWLWHRRPALSELKSLWSSATLMSKSWAWYLAFFTFPLSRDDSLCVSYQGDWVSRVVCNWQLTLSDFQHLFFLYLAIATQYHCSYSYYRYLPILGLLFRHLI